MHRKAAAATRRRHGSFKIIAQIRAYQGRGLIHRHLLLPGKTFSERAATETYCREIASRTAAHGYGFTKLGAKLEGRTHKFIDGLRAQGYLVKYVVKEDSAGRPEVLETVTHPDTAGQVHYVQPGLSPWTMEAFRKRRRAHVLLREHGCEPLAARSAMRPAARPAHTIGWTIEHTNGCTAEAAS
jgi:hypothetical protein